MLYPLVVKMVKEGMTVSRPINDAPLSEIIRSELTRRHCEIQDIIRIKVSFRRPV